MHIARFMIVGGSAGLVFVMTSSWLITGFAFHRFQRLTPATWRAESWRLHALAVAAAVLSGAVLGTVESHIPYFFESAWNSLRVAVLIWAATAAPVILTMATYINLHRGVVVGLLLEWLLFVTGVSLIRGGGLHPLSKAITAAY